MVNIIRCGRSLSQRVSISGHWLIVNALQNESFLLFFIQFSYIFTFSFFSGRSSKGFYVPHTYLTGGCIYGMVLRGDTCSLHSLPATQVECLDKGPLWIVRGTQCCFSLFLSLNGSILFQNPSTESGNDHMWSMMSLRTPTGLFPTDTACFSCKTRSHLVGICSSFLYGKLPHSLCYLEEDLH